MKQYTSEQIQRAENTDLEAYLRGKGVPLSGENGSFRVNGPDGPVITGNTWYWASRRQGGRALSYVTKVEGIPFKEAVRTLIGEEPMEVTIKPIPLEYTHLGPKELYLPLPADSYHDMYTSLMKQGIPQKLIDSCVEKRLLYESDIFQDVRPNGRVMETYSAPRTIFVCRDREGKARAAYSHVCWGGNAYDVPGSDKTYGFSIPAQGARSVWVFEYPIDLLSHATLSLYDKQSYPVHRVALGGLSPMALIRFLNEHPEIRTVNLALSADKSGEISTDHIGKKLTAHGYTVHARPPRYGRTYHDTLLEVQRRILEKRRGQQEVIR